MRLDTVIDPKISVVIVNYNGIAYLEPCLSSIEKQTYPSFEVILVDNGSSDGSVDLVKGRFPSVRVIVNERNLGFAEANNVGINASEGALIATLNNDTEVDPRWLESLARAMGTHERVGMCASKMLFMWDRTTINSVGICVSRSGACWDRGMFEPDHGQYEAPEEVFGPCAGAALYRKSMLDEIGLFDGDFFAYMEDVDLAFRARAAGWKCLYVPGAIVYHVNGGTAGYMSDLSIYLGNRNIVWNFVKNFHGRLLFGSVLWAVGRNIASIPYYALQGRGKPAMRAKIDALKGIPTMATRRKAGKADVSGFVETWAKIPHKP
jgi:hypothetical protein